MTHSIVGILSAAVRLTNSRSGNPRWRVTVSGTRYITDLDSATALGVHPPSHLGEVVQIRLNAANRIINYTFLKG